MSLVLAALLATCPAAPQEPVAGQLPGTQRWIVLFEQPGFDLEPLRATIAARAPQATSAALIADLEQRARAERAPFRAYVESLEGRVTDHWWIINGCAIEIAPAHLDAVRAQAGVADLQPDALRRPAALPRLALPSLTPPVPIKDATNASNHNADAVHALGFRGAGTTVAVLDSGIDENMNGVGRPHRTFFVNGDPNNQTGGGLSGSRVLVNRQMGGLSADDIIAHGTAVAACAAGETWLTANGDAGQAPAAKIASYSMSDLPNGFALVTTMVNSWQQVVTDRVALGISVANLSYTGTAIPTWAEQQAMDNAAFVGDIAIAVMGGNEQTFTHFAHGALNVLSVGAVETDSRLVADFSVIGPIETNRARFFPEIVANGVNLKMPQADVETNDKQASGTSVSSPQVAGAMAVYRGMRPQATSLETRAAAIATTEPISNQNREFQFHTRNAYGLGYLRTDRLVALARDTASLRASGTVTTAQPRTRFSLTVVQGQWYSVGLAWNRLVASHDDWSNLDLEVSFAGTKLAEATTPFNVHEKVVFRAATSGTVDVDVIAVRFENGVATVPFGVAGGASLPGMQEASTRSFGTGCGNGRPQLGVADLPITGETYTLRAFTSPGVTSVAFLIGASDSVWLGTPLPLNLTPIGAPGCRLYVSGEIILGRAVTSGVATLTLAIPLDPALVGGSVFHQVIEPGSNPLGFHFSGGLELTVGGTP